MSDKDSSSAHLRRIEPVDFSTIDHDEQAGATSESDEANQKHLDQLCHPKRVAAYARVSTEQEEQENSYKSQITYYTEYITSQPNWQLVQVYADHGISGTSYKYRPSFLQMIEDAKRGKIDLILTKSISRFARNTVDALAITRELKEKHVEVFFEKENISSFDADAELVFTIMSAIAQEESRVMSENVRWGKERSREAGRVYFAYKNFLGYKRGTNGEPVIDEKEAKIVRNIYHAFLSGNSYNAIASQLTRDGVLTPTGRLTWTPSTVKSILTNEKYKGDARLGKTYVEDYLTHKVKVNKGERKQYYVHNSHEAIIPPEVFDKVQEEIVRRKGSR